jgi:hypothetical protein
MRAIFPALTASPSGADVTVKDTKRYADTHGWCYYNFNQPSPKAQTAKVRVREEMHRLRYCQCQERHLDPILSSAGQVTPRIELMSWSATLIGNAHLRAEQPLHTSELCASHFLVEQPASVRKLSARRGSTIPSRRTIPVFSEPPRQTA